MSSKFPAIRAVLIGLLASCFSAVAAEPASSPQLLVLDNGNVLAGDVVREEDYYHVRFEHGELRVKVAQVDFVCLTMHEAYLRLRAQRTGSTADSHVELARWCLRHELLAEATRELQTAADIDPHHRGLALAQRQLKQARDRAQREPVPQETQVVVAGHQMEIDDTDRVALGRIPQRARVDFVKHIQPMLGRNCGNAGCHQPQSDQTLQIDRLALDGVGHPDVTRRNLIATLTQVDTEQPEKSPLLTFAAAVHGSAQTGQSEPFQPHQLEILQDWLEQLAPQGEQKNDTPNESTETLPEVGLSPTQASDRGRPIAELRFPTVPVSQLHKARGEHPRETADPFDPQQFNRKYAGQQEFADESSREQTTQDESRRPIPTATRPESVE